MKPGLYEQIINKQMNEELASVPEECRYQEKVDSAEASRVLATYAAELMKRKMDAIYEASGDQAPISIRSSARWMWRRMRRCRSSIRESSF